MEDGNQSLAFIVDRLNDSPFQMNLTMVAFDEKSPFELLEVVNEVMAHLCTAIDYKDNDKLLEEQVNHMCGNTLRAEGVAVKLVTRWPPLSRPTKRTERPGPCGRRPSQRWVRTAPY